MKKIITLFCILFIALSIIDAGGLNTKADSSGYFTVNLTGDCEYEEAYALLEYINAERMNPTKEGYSACQPLTIDNELMEIAMFRAAEICANFDHIRPNGKQWYSVSSKLHSENIASGSFTAKGTFEQWYNSEGHYNNFMDSDYKSIGIGCFIYNNFPFWVQNFSKEDGSGTCCVTNQDGVTYQVEISSDENYPVEFNIDSDINQSCSTGTSLDLNVYRTNPGWTYIRCIFDDDSFNWTSSDTTIATVSEDGVVNFLEAGEVTISATPYIGTVSPITIAFNVIQECLHENTEIFDAQSVTCTENGYSGDVYCTDCGYLIEIGEIIPASGHIYGGWQIVKAPSCADYGTIEMVCVVCGDTITETIDITDTHTPGNAVKENLFEATYTTEVSYDEVVYCAVCGKELSRTKIVTDKLETPENSTDSETTTVETTENVAIESTTEVSTVILGDINGDGIIKANDARKVLRFSAELETPTDAEFQAADVNKDGQIRANDARKILRASAQLEDPSTW